LQVHGGPRSAVVLEQSSAAWTQYSEYFADIPRNQRLVREMLEDDVAEDEVDGARLCGSEVRAIAQLPGNVTRIFVYGLCFAEHLGRNIEGIDLLPAAGEAAGHSPGAATQLEHRAICPDVAALKNRSHHPAVIFFTRRQKGWNVPVFFPGGNVV